ncbi:MAG: imidazolonepropionase [Bacteroidetes bacterium]|nr:imidazolonepropionase [Bacteroidota bacterium]
MRKLFYNIGRIWGVESVPLAYKSGNEMSVVDAVDNAWLLAEDGLIADWGAMASDLPAADQSLDCTGMELLPGLVDSHTHVVFAATRTTEWELRLKGASYEEIAAAGGGILNSAAKLRVMDEQRLYDESLERVLRMIAHGTTTLEIKSGYGLSLESEMKMLRIARRIGHTVPATVKTTFLGAHAVPPEFKGNREGYVEHVIDTMLPAVAAENLADHVDVFCDRGFFTPDETMRILAAADKLGLPAKIHANELGLTGGVQAAVKAGAWSADHLEHTGEEEVLVLRQSQTMPVGLPGTSYFLGIPYTPGRMLIDAGLPFAIATDFNPGSSPLCSLQMAWSLACTQMRLLPSEGLNAITLNAARALRLEQICGSVARGKRADFWLTRTRDAMNSVPYYFGVNHASQVFILGNLQ